MEQKKRYPLNAPGEFYVEDGKCITCMVPHHEAPDLMGFYTDPAGANRLSHCYFKKQPSTPDEVSKAICAVQASCCSALRYAGTDPAILKSFEEYESVCDNPAPKPWWRFW